MERVLIKNETKERFIQDVVEVYKDDVVIIEVDICIPEYNDDKFALIYSKEIQSTFICHMNINAVIHAIALLKNDENKNTDSIKEVVEWSKYNKDENSTDDTDIIQKVLTKRCKYTELNCGNLVTETAQPWIHQIVLHANHKKGDRYVILKSEGIKDLLAEKIESFFSLVEDEFGVKHPKYKFLEVI